jgi:DNA-3-methyladenine glycosylase
MKSGDAAAAWHSPLPMGFYDRPVTIVARELIGQVLVRATEAGICAGRIVETEAYLANDDSASHSYHGPNRKNATMFREAGRLYVYTIHARCCMNAVTEPPGVGSAVLFRAIEPLVGVDLMEHRRKHARLLDLARGPARLCEAMDIDRRFDGWDLTCGDRIWVAADKNRLSTDQVGQSSRIGVTSARDLALRFFVRGSRFVSGPRTLNLAGTVSADGAVGDGATSRRNAHRPT